MPKGLVNANVQAYWVHIHCVHQKVYDKCDMYMHASMHRALRCIVASTVSAIAWKLTRYGVRTFMSSHVAGIFALF